MKNMLIITFTAALAVLISLGFYNIEALLRAPHLAEGFTLLILVSGFALAKLDREL
ncbi:hypothetical protein [Vibrio barjaei]|uniref:hypothetical protein n=1 Tax=Vibrio barjaei TaxID=1676683 RepID=UPI002283E8F4|nr:hypothetical protein [Vibrio barjaei]MCY9872954.1 hypothetical protein [Vibrio barjaei]